MSWSPDVDDVAPALDDPVASCDGTVAVSPGPGGVAGATPSPVGPSAPRGDGMFAQTTDTFVGDFFDKDEPCRGTI